MIRIPFQRRSKETGPRQEIETSLWEAEVHTLTQRHETPAVNFLEGEERRGDTDVKMKKEI